MGCEKLVHTHNLILDGQEYLIQVFVRPNGHHMAKTFLSSTDVVINDGQTLEEVIAKQIRLLPLALASRQFKAGHYRT